MSSPDFLPRGYDRYGRRRTGRPSRRFGPLPDMPAGPPAPADPVLVPAPEPGVDRVRPAGFYPDPGNVDQARFFDGEEWDGVALPLADRDAAAGVLARRTGRAGLLRLLFIGVTVGAAAAAAVTAASAADPADAGMWVLLTVIGGAAWLFGVPGYARRTVAYAQLLDWYDRDPDGCVAVSRALPAGPVVDAGEPGVPADLVRDSVLATVERLLVRLLVRR